MIRICILILVFLTVSCTLEKTLYPPEGFGPPMAELRISPTIGDTTTYFVISASKSKDADNVHEMLEVRFDLDNDGIWDTHYSKIKEWVEVFAQPGLHTVSVEVKDRFGQTSVDSASVITYGSLYNRSHLTDPRDGQVYRTVMINNTEWMAENLNIGQMIPVTEEATDNQIVEKYVYQDNPLPVRSVGGYYTFYDWMELMNYDTTSVTGICPPGWQIPENEDWEELIQSGRGLVEFYAEDGFSNLDLTRIGVQPMLQPWSVIDTNPYTSYWSYYSRSYDTRIWNYEERIIPYVASSVKPKPRNHIHLIIYSSESVRKYMGIAPVRCIRKEE